ncbi:MAG: hypothetical protein WCQ83_05375 [Endomicrobiia bacterium]
MPKKICGILILFSMLSSNLLLNLMSAYSFIVEKNSTSYNNINLQSQCNVIVNIPKDFINMCVKVGQEMNSFNTIANKFSNILAKEKSNFSGSKFALILNNSKLKTIKPTQNRTFNNIPIPVGTNIYYLFMVILIFYMVGYIGLLRLFNDSLYKKNYFVKSLKLCLINVRQSFILETK